MSSSYTRFLDSEKLSKHFWAFSPRNPSCGLISLERGSRIWIWLSLMGCAVYALRLAGLLFQEQQLRLSTDEWQILRDSLKNKISSEETISLPIHPILEWFSKFVVCLLFGFYTCKLFRAVVNRDVPLLKKRFTVVLLISFVWFAMVCFEIMGWLEFLNLPQSLNLPGIGITIVFQLTGLLFIYSFIASLITPPHQECNDSSIAANHGRNGDADMV